MRKIILSLMLLTFMIQAEEIYATFTVEAKKSANLAFTSSGTVNRVAVEVSSLVKKGEIPAIRPGKAYLISDPDAQRILGKRMTEKDKARVETAVRKTICDYGDTLKWLSKE